jgi:hypothetical protein
MDYRYTSHQVARGARADAVSGGTRYLIKNVSSLRLTYQVRLLTFLASESRGRLIVHVPRSCRLSPDLKGFVRDHAAVLKIERVR